MTNENKTPELIQLQEEALRREVDIKDDDGKELSEQDLRAALELKSETDGGGGRDAEPPQGDEESDEEYQYRLATANAKKAGAEAREEAQSSGRSIPDMPLPPSITSNAPTGRRPRSGNPPKREPARLDKELASKLGLPDATDADIALAKKHDYPVVIPGARAYVTDISMRCALGGGEREAGKVILLTDAHAARKHEYLNPVEDDEPEEIEQSEPEHDEPPVTQRRTTSTPPKAHSGKGGKSGGGSARRK